jgi:hypothetical protein
MDADKAKLGIALVVFILYAVLIAERLYRILKDRPKPALSRRAVGRREKL